MSIDIAEVAAIEFVPLDESEGEALADDLIYGVNVVSRLAQTIVGLNKQELTDAMLRGGPQAAQDALDCLKGTDGHLTMLSELVAAAEARIMIAMGVVAQG